MENHYSKMYMQWDKLIQKQKQQYKIIGGNIMETNEELVDKIASFFEKEDNWRALMRNCWLENGRSDNLRSLLREAMK